MELVCADSLEAVERLRSSWEALQSADRFPNVNSDIDRYISVVKSLGSQSSPHVIMLSREGRPVAMLLGRIEEQGVDVRIGYRTILKPRLKALTIVHGGVLGSFDGEVAREVSKHLDGLFADGTVDVVFFNHISAEMPVYGAVREMAGFFRLSHLAVKEPRWIMTMPESMDAFYGAMSTVTRRSMRRAVKSIEKEYPERVEHVVFEGGERLDAIMAEMHSVSVKTYQHAMGVGFVDTPAERQRYRDAAALGWLRVHLLRVDGECIAFDAALEYKGSYFLIAAGYDPALRNLAPGKVLVQMVINYLCNNRAVERLDFGFGDADYKRVYCDSSIAESQVYLFAPRVRTILLNMARTAALGIGRLCTLATERIGSIGRIKRAWRDRLRKTRAAEGSDDAQQGES